MSRIKRLVRVLVTTGGVVGAGLAVPDAARAQAKVELVPFFSSFYPLANVNEFTGSGGETVKERQYAAPGFGGRLRFWLSNKVGIEASGVYSSSGTRFTSDDTAATGGFSLAGNVITVNGRVLLRPARTNLHFILGAGIVRRGGDTWSFPGLDKLTNFAGVGGLGLHAAVTPRFSLDLSLEANLYSFDPDGSSGTFYEKSRFQSDILVSIGVPITLSR